LQEFYHTAPVEERPKILGLTACPTIGGIKNLVTGIKQEKQMIELELNLDAKIVKPSFVDEESFCAHPDETIEFFGVIPEEVRLRNEIGCKKSFLLYMFVYLVGVH
jgi:hypothetical protein